MRGRNCQCCVAAMCVRCRRTAILSMSGRGISRRLSKPAIPRIKYFAHRTIGNSFCMGIATLRASGIWRNTVPASDRAFLAVLKIAWEPTYRPVLDGNTSKTAQNPEIAPYNPRTIYSCTSKTSKIIDHTYCAFGLTLYKTFRRRHQGG